MIPVTKPFLPPIAEYTKQVERAFKNEWLTNRGELVIELEKKLRNYLALDNILITTNGTLPIQIALKLLGNSGEIITTPFSYVATTSSIVWENCTPIFVDIDETYLTIDEKKIEEAITNKTTCILATHVFGNPCDVLKIESIANKHKLKVIYDAAHSFGTKFNGKSIFEYGDVSTCSFHATKVFHTGEGGAVFCKDNDLFDKIFYSHNFGHDGPVNFHGLGINAKISELQAAMGLSVFPYLSDIFIRRKNIYEYYLYNIVQNGFQLISLREGLEWNYGYFPLLFENKEKLEEVEFQLKKREIFPRRYFYPSLNTLNYVEKQSMPISESVASRILCIPIYHSMTEKDLELIVGIINM